MRMRCGNEVTLLILHVTKWYQIFMLKDFEKLFLLEWGVTNCICSLEVNISGLSNFWRFLKFLNNLILLNSAKPGFQNFWNSRIHTDFTVNDQAHRTCLKEKKLPLFTQLYIAKSVEDCLDGQLGSSCSLSHERGWEKCDMLGSSWEWTSR